MGQEYKSFSVTFSLWASYSTDMIIISLDVPIVDSDSRPATSEYKFGSIDTPLG